MSGDHAGLPRSAASTTTWSTDRRERDHRPAVPARRGRTAACVQDSSVARPPRAGRGRPRRGRRRRGRGCRGRRGRGRRAAALAVSSSNRRMSASGRSPQHPLDDVRQQHVGDRLEGADVDPATPGVETVDGVASSPRPARAAGVACGEDQASPQRGDAGAAGPTRAVEDDATDAPLERGDLLAQRGLCVAEVGRSRDRRCPVRATASRAARRRRSSTSLYWRRRSRSSRTIAFADPRIVLASLP